MTIGQKYDFTQMSPVNFNVFFLLFRNSIYKMKRNAFKSFCLDILYASCVSVQLF